MVSQYCGDKEEEREMARMRGFHRFEQCMSKDSFHVPQIDQLVDIMVGHPQMSFLDAF